MADYSDTFTYTNGTLSGKGSWLTPSGATSLGVYDNRIDVNIGVLAYGVNYYNNTFASAHYSKAQVSGLTSSNDNARQGVGVRIQSGANSYYFAVQSSTNQIYVGQVVSGTESIWETVTAGSIVDDDYIELSIDGSTTTTLYLKVNGSTIKTYTGKDALTGGYAGIVGYGNDGTSIDNWTGGDVAGVTNTNYSPGAGAAALTGQLPLVNPQYSRPSSDVSDGGWTPSTGADLYAVLDEATRDDADYITSPTNPTGSGTDTCTVKLATITDPGVDTGFQVQWAATATGATGTVVGSLRQGNAPGTEIASWTHASLTVGSYMQFGDEVTATQAGNITDFSDLYFRIVAS